MSYSKDLGHEQATSLSETPAPSLVESTPKKANPFANFTIGNWSADIWADDLWEDDEVDASNEESSPSSSGSGTTTPPSSSSSPSPSSDSDTDSDSDSTDDWQGLRHEKSPLHRLDGLALKQSAKDEGDDSSSDTSTPEPSDSGDDEYDDENIAEQVFTAQRTLVFRALYPQRRETLYPRRKRVVLNTTPLRLPAVKEACPKCSSTVFRIVLDHCTVCALQKAKNKLYNIEDQQRLEDEEQRRRGAEICEAKAAIESMDPENYMQDLDWQDLRTEEVDMKDEMIERRAGFEVRVAELENEIEQYEMSMSEDLDRAR